MTTLCGLQTRSKRYAPFSAAQTVPVCASSKSTASSSRLATSNQPRRWKVPACSRLSMETLCHRQSSSKSSSNQLQSTLLSPFRLHSLVRDSSGLDANRNVAHSSTPNADASLDHSVAHTSNPSCASVLHARVDVRNASCERTVKRPVREAAPSARRRR